jgi:hypothetical protein
MSAVKNYLAQHRNGAVVALVPPSAQGIDLTEGVDLRVQVAAAINSGDKQRQNDNADALKQAVEEINKAWFISIEGGKVNVWNEGRDHELNRPMLTPLNVTDFNTLLANRSVRAKDASGNEKSTPLSTFWLRSPDRREYLKGMALLPDTESPAGVYNLWQGWGVQAVGGDVFPLQNRSPALGQFCSTRPRTHLSLCSLRL